MKKKILLLVVLVLLSSCCWLLGEDQELLKTLGEINRLNLKEEYTIDEINDYMNVILEYNIKVEMTRLKEQMKRITDPLEKANIAKQIVDLKMRRDERD